MLAELLQAIHADPRDDVAWMAVADWLEEQGDPRPELIRLTQKLRHEPPGPLRAHHEARLRDLLLSGLEAFMVRFTNSLGMQLVLIPSGRFLMGSPLDEPYHSPDEGPVHEVAIRRPFYLGRFPVTQAEYESLTASNPSQFSPAGPLPYYRVRGADTARFPVDSVDFPQAEEFCRLMSLLPEERRAGRVYRLPTEAEWEYACRACSSTIFTFGDDLGSTQANFDGNYPYGGALRHVYLRRTCPVGQYLPNAFGLYDMHGNVWEWCADWYDEGYYRKTPAYDPTGPIEGDGYVLRGGSWIDAGWHCRSADRSHREALHYVGFRVAMDIPDERELRTGK